VTEGNLDRKIIAQNLLIVFIWRVIRQSQGCDFAGGAIVGFYSRFARFGFDNKAAFGP